MDLRRRMAAWYAVARASEEELVAAGATASASVSTEAWAAEDSSWYTRTTNACDSDSMASNAAWYAVSV
jgi:hypothetical protein